MGHKHDYCGCEQSTALLDALNEAWVALAVRTVRSAWDADEIITKALDANHELLLAYKEESEPTK